MPRGMGRGYGRGFRYHGHRFLPFGGFRGFIDAVFLLIMLYLLVKLFLVSAGYVIALVVLYILWGWIRRGL
ncbi:hypothetical protein [Thermococcus sp.]